MRDFINNLLGFIYSLGIGDYFFFIGTFLLIILFIYIIYLIKCSDEESAKEVKTTDTFDLEAVSKDIEENYKPAAIKLTSYEEEQENNAIISYDELVKNKTQMVYNYDDEFEYETKDLDVKKFDLNNTSEIVIPKEKLNVKLMSYEKEEEFLEALKKLQSNLSQ